MTLLELLNLETGASEETLGKIIATAPRRYKVYEIPKRTGGTRTIAHPARELKALQRVILHSLLDNLYVSEIATAYVKNRGIAYNAEMHLGQRWILKLDFQNFFHSIKPTDWDRVVRRTEKLRPFAKDANLFHQLLFWGAGGKVPWCLSIGAPTSPMVSNLVCARLDTWMVEHAAKVDVRVSRYADDITVSGDSVAKLLRFERLLENALKSNRGVKLELNREKRGLYGPGVRKMVTGVILTPDGKLSIGRERKREISSLVHRFTLNSSDYETVMKTKGLLAFAISIEPTFFATMQEKYGDDVIYRLMRFGNDIEIPLEGLEF